MSDGDGHDLIESGRDWLMSFLNRVRDAAVRASAGPAGEQRRTPGVQSGTNLPGLIKRLTAVEEHHSQRVFPGEDRTINMSADMPAGPTGDEALAACRQARARRSARFVPISYPSPDIHQADGKTMAVVA